MHGGRFDSLGLDESNAPVIVEYKRGVDVGVVNQGLFYMSWLLDYRDAFHRLVHERLGSAVAAQVVWSAPRLICVAGDFTRYDIHAVRERRRSIALVRTASTAPSTSAWRPAPPSPDSPWTPRQEAAGQE